MSEEARLRRHLRALAAVNRQLQAQLEGSGRRAVALPASARTAGPVDGDLVSHGAPAPAPLLSLRRGAHAGPWLEQLQLTAGASSPHLVRRAGRAIFLVEGTHRREVRSGILAAGLEQVLGEPRDVTDEELARFTVGVPVEVLEGPSGPAFVVVGGTRWSLRGLPLPHPVSADEMQLFPEGEGIDLATANVSRARYEEARRAGGIGRRATAARTSPGRAVRAVARRARRALRGG
jgi:hypothetical protein